MSQQPQNVVVNVHNDGCFGCIGKLIILVVAFLVFAAVVAMIKRNDPIKEQPPVDRRRDH